MPLSHLEHYLIMARDMAATRDWYIDALGFTEGPHPDFRFPVCWLYLGDRDVIHITASAADSSENRKKYLGEAKGGDDTGSGAIDHVAFRASGLKETMNHLESRGIDFSQRQVADQGLYQLFLFDPNGIKVELNFPAEEVEGLRAPVMASEFEDQS